jgi:hypothetical protein
MTYSMQICQTGYYDCSHDNRVVLLHADDKVDFGSVNPLESGFTILHGYARCRNSNRDRMIRLTIDQCHTLTTNANSARFTY